MKRSYHCPKCHGVLNPNVKIILKATRGGRSALLLFSPQPGNYQVIAPSAFPLKRGDEVQFFCPLCSRTLASRSDRSMAEIDFSTPDGQSGRVVFSRTYGHEETYFVTKEEVRSFGRHADQEGVNYWGAGRRE